jgi:hypothetical protein
MSTKKINMGTNISLDVNGYSFIIPDRLCKLDHVCYESKILFKWIMVWYLQNHLEYSSLENITKKDINNYITRTQRIILIYENDLPISQFNLDNLDKKILSKIPK